MGDEIDPQLDGSRGNRPGWTSTPIPLRFARAPSDPHGDRRWYNPGGHLLRLWQAYLDRVFPAAIQCLWYPQTWIWPGRRSSAARRSWLGGCRWRWRAWVPGLPERRGWHAFVHGIRHLCWVRWNTGVGPTIYRWKFGSDRFRPRADDDRGRYHVVTRGRGRHGVERQLRSRHVGWWLSRPRPHR